ncbi:MAG: flagellar hook-length control protein FliK, partial [Gammaproteobacteria bacterium]|nr:flagellar hook-length control protein FliK [Gammaproteobacteria bacterium]
TETSNPEPETAAAQSLLNLPVAEPEISTGNTSQPGGNPPPQTGNMLPAGIATPTNVQPVAQPVAQRWAAAAPAGSGEIDAGLPRTDAATLQAATNHGTQAQQPPLHSAEIRIPTGPVPAAQPSNGDPAAESTRADSLRAGVLDSFSLADQGADTSMEGGDTQNGDGRRQLPDGLMRLVPADRADAPNGARVTAEFSLNAGPAATQTTELAAPAARPADTTTLALLSGQRPLQPLGDQAQWSQGLGQRLMMMADGGVQTARIKLHPEHLGQLDVRIEIEEDTARVWFTANSGQAREAIESTLPKLREMFESNGLDLVGTDVSDEAQRFVADPDAAPSGGRAADFDTDASSANDPSAGQTVMRVSDRLVDLYA